jgi:hypothetical protein
MTEIRIQDDNVHLIPFILNAIDPNRHLVEQTKKIAQRMSCTKLDQRRETAWRRAVWHEQIS